MADLSFPGDSDNKGFSFSDDYDFPTNERDVFLQEQREDEQAKLEERHRQNAERFNANSAAIDEPLTEQGQEPEAEQPVQAFVSYDPEHPFANAPLVNQEQEDDRMRRAMSYANAQKKMSVLDSIFFYDEDKKSRDNIDSSDDYFFFKDRMWREENDTNMGIIGEEYLKVMERGGLIPKGYSSLPREVALTLADRWENPEERKQFLDMIAQIDGRANVTSQDYYQVIARMRKADVTRQREQQASLRKQDDSLVQAMQRGDELSLEQQQQLSDFRRRVTPKNYNDFVALHNFAKKYIAPLRKEESGESIARKLHDASEALYQFVGDDEERAEMAAFMLKSFADEVKNAKKVSVLDEFVISIGRQLSAMSQQVEEATAESFNANRSTQVAQATIDRYTPFRDEYMALRDALDKPAEERTEDELNLIKKYRTNRFVQKEENLREYAQKQVDDYNGFIKNNQAVIDRYAGRVAEGKAKKEDIEARARTRGFIKNALDTMVQLPDNQPWYWDYSVGAARVAAQAVGDTSLYIGGGIVGSAVGMPWLGMALGSAGQIVQANTDTYDKLRASGLTHEEARNEALTQGFINAAVEMIPGSSIGSIGFHRTLGWLAKRGSNVAARVANWADKSVLRGFAVETLAGATEEAVIEPTVAGFLTWGTQAIYDRFHVPHAESKEFRKCFDELSQMFNDPRQLAGILIFSAAMGARETTSLGGLLPEGAIQAKVRYDKAEANNLRCTGFSEDEIERIKAQPPGQQEAMAAEFNARHWREEPEETAKRIIDANRDYIRQHGAPLDFTGLIEVAERGGKKYNISAIQSALAAQWQALAQKGFLPFVSLNADGTYHVEKILRQDEVTQDGEADKNVKKNEQTGERSFSADLTADQANAYLISEIERYERFRREELRKSVGKDAANAFDLRSQMLLAVSRQLGRESISSIEETSQQTGISIEDVTNQLPEDIAAGIRRQGFISYNDALDIAAWAQGVIDAKGPAARQQKPTRGDLVVDDERLAGMSQEQRDAAISGHVMSFGYWADFANNFRERVALEGKKPEEARIKVFRQSAQRATIDGRNVLAQTLFTPGDKVNPQNTLEDVTESVLTQMMDDNAQELMNNNPDLSYDDALARAYDEMGRMLEDAIKVISDGQKLPVSALKKDENGHYTPLSVREAMSSLAVSNFMYDEQMPESVRQLQDFADGLLDAASAISTVKQAFALALNNAPNNAVLQDLQKLFETMGGTVRTAFSRMRMEGYASSAERVASGAKAVRAELGGTRVLDVDEAQSLVDASNTTIKQENELKTLKVDGASYTQKQVVENTQAAFNDAEPSNVQAPAIVKGIFDNDQCIWYADGEYYMGLVSKDKITQISKQVKLGETDDYGALKGRKLQGPFIHDAPPLMLWLRKNGELVLVSGRHRFSKMMEDETVTSHPCYVYIEDARHDELWAEILDYETNMRDNQADEKTCAYYIRHRPLDNAQLQQRGLLRGGSIAKRGILIGRVARENLYNLFMNDEVKPADAEMICLLTKDLRDESRIENLQSRCAILKKQGKSWDYIGSVLQLMASDTNIKDEQGLLDLGADYEKSLDNAATYIEKVIANLRKGIQSIKQNKRNISDKTRSETLKNTGASATSGEYDNETLDALQAELKRWLNAGSYPELISSAYNADPDAQPKFSERISAEVAQRMQEAKESGEVVAKPVDDSDQGLFNFNDGSASIEDIREQGLFQNGVFVASNGVLIDRRGDDFSAAIENAQSASPALYREPNLDKVGTGEGNQTEGWGLYWSTRWEANAFYHKAFTNISTPIAPGSKEERLMRLLGEALNVNDGDERALYDLGKAIENSERDELRDELYSALENKGASDEDLDFFFKAFENMDIYGEYLGDGKFLIEVDTLVNDDRVVIRINPEGKYAVNYLADLDVDDSNVLHWDEPASRLFDEHPGLLEAYRNEGGEYTGKEKGKDVYWGLARALGSDKAASQWLDARGIRGNKYLDGMSRRHEDVEKMYNYVIFNEDYIKITRINNRHPWSEYSEDNPDWQLPEDVSFSVEEAKERGMFKDGVMGADNAVIFDSGRDISMAFEFDHVSPHLFPYVDYGHVGNGEGAQMFGWGVLYGLTNPNVFRYYYEQFSDKIAFSKKGRGEIFKRDDVLNDLEKVGGFLNREINKDIIASVVYCSSFDRALVKAKNDLESTKRNVAYYEEAEKRGESLIDESTMRTLREAVEELEYSIPVLRWLEDNYTTTRKTFLPVAYHVVADMDDSNVLHWDDMLWDFMKEHPELEDALKALADKSGHEAPIFGYISGQHLYEWLCNVLGSPRSASEWLDAHGIRGVKYLDGVSRGRWERGEEDEPYTYNFVVFNPDYIRITHINNRKGLEPFSPDSPLWQSIDSVDFSEWEPLIDSVDFSSSMDFDNMQEYVASILEGNIGDGTGLACAQEWNNFYVDFTTWAAKEQEDEGIGNYLGRMMQLMAATWRVLPENYKRGSQGLAVMRRWLKWYSDMNETGQVRKSTELSGKVYNKALAALEDKMEYYSNIYTTQEAQDMMRRFAGKKAIVILESIAQKCRQMLDAYVKDSMKTDMLAEIKALYPKMEKGEKTKKGKATTDTYRYVERVREALMMRGKDFGTDEKHKRRIESLKNLLRKGNLTDERRIVLESELDKLCSEEDNELQNAIEACHAVINNNETSDEQKDIALETLHAYTMFGGWRFKDIAEAQSAYLTFKKIVREGRMEWKRQQEERKAFIQGLINHVRDDGQWRKSANPQENAQNFLQNVRTSAGKRARTRDMADTAGWGFTSLVGKLDAAQKKLGTWFVSRYKTMIAHMHQDIKAKQDEELDWLYKNLSKVSGRHTLEGICDWVRENDVMKNTGITLNRIQRQYQKVSSSLIDEWMTLPVDERKSWLESHNYDEQDSYMFDELSEQLFNDRAFGFEREEYEFVTEMNIPTPLETTKWGCLQALLTAEQPYYEHLLRENGLNPDTLQQLRQYIGPELIEFGHAMRDHLKDARGAIAEMHERIYALPFPEMENYFPARFMHPSGTGPVDDSGKIIDVYSGLLPGRPDSFRTRTLHYRDIDWGRSALEVFIQTQRQQDNWLITGDFIGEWASIFSDNAFGLELNANLGEQWQNKIKADMRALANATLGEVDLSAINRIVAMFCKVAAVTYLAYSPRTTAKNASSIFNGYFGGVIPLEVIAHDGVPIATEERRITFLEWIREMFDPSGFFSVADIAKEKFIRVRMLNQYKRIQAAANEPASNSKFFRAVRSALYPVEGAALAAQNAGMRPIEWSDVGGNILGARALANAVYRSLSKDDKFSTLSPEQKERIKKRMSLDYAMRALDYLAQPFVSSQKVTFANTKQFGGTMADASLYLFKSEQMAKFGGAVSGMMSGSIAKGVHGAAVFFLADSSAWLFGRAMDYALGCALSLMTGKERQPLWGDMKSLFYDYLASGFASSFGAIPFFGDFIRDGINQLIDKPGYRWSNALDQYIYPFRKLSKARTAEEKALAICNIIRVFGYAGFGAVFGTPANSLLEMLLAVSGLTNPVTQGLKTITPPAKSKRGRSRKTSDTSGMRL